MKKENECHTDNQTKGDKKKILCHEQKVGLPYNQENKEEEENHHKPV